MKYTGLVPAEILLPERCDMQKWACVACDQFTSEKEYWDKLAAFVGDEKSTLKLVLPEIYLNDRPEERIYKINENINDYLKSGVFRKLPKGYILTVRSTPFVKKRIGLIACADLETYDYRPGAKSLIRATERTIEERIPPRLKIRENAAIELPHIMILFDDEKREICEKLYDKRERFEKVYDFDLNMGGGRVEGWFIPESENVQQAFSALIDNERLIKKYGVDDEFAFAVGDGNHSLATAKAHWEKVKANLTESERVNHPARYALCEFVNVYDEGIYFQPIFRFVKGVDRTAFIKALKENVSGHYRVNDGSEISEVRGNGLLAFVISEIDKFTSEYISAHGGAVDYVHGEKNLDELVKGDKSAVGIITDTLDKSQLFNYVSGNGVFPKKTFSMGEGVEKRYYLEAKRIKL